MQRIGLGQDRVGSRLREAAQLPGAHSAGVGVDEVGSWIKTDSSQTQRESGIAQLNERDVGQTDVDGLALHVEAPGGDPFGSMPKHFVGGGRAVAGNDLIRPGALDERVQTVKQVEQADVDRMDLGGAKVAQQMIDGGQCLCQVLALVEVFDGETLTRLKVIEAQCAKSCGSGEQASC